jgi:integrase/recombinase XerD
MTRPLPSPLAFSDWPSGDQHRWRRGIFADPLSEEGGGGGAKWRQVTRTFNERGYGHWLAWLEARGELDPDAGGAPFATLARVRAYHSDIVAAGYADHSRAGRLRSLAAALRVMEPAGDYRFIRKAAQRISARAQRVRPLQHRMRRPEDVLRLGLELMSEAAQGSAGRAKANALLFRDGLLIALWVSRPLRISNLAMIEVGRHLCPTEVGYRLEFEPEEMKSARPFACFWPAKLEAPLREYLTRYRPLLLSRNDLPEEEHGLWISQRGRALALDSMAAVIEARTKAAFGLAINPHLIRHIVATAVAERHPEQVADVAAILGHSSLESSERHYNLAGGAHAAAKFQSVLAERVRRRHDS